MKKPNSQKNSRKKVGLNYQDSDKKLQVIQNEEIAENTRLTKYALWVAVFLGLADILIETLQLLK